ncbi:MAG: hypothetical protein ACLF0P_12395, partial [Thermoanaerobaculia bacterium]
MRLRHGIPVALLVSLVVTAPAAAVLTAEGGGFWVQRSGGSWQENPVAAFGPEGVSLVVWQDTRHGVQGQLFGPEGTKRGPVLDLVSNRLPSIPGEGLATFAVEPAAAFLPGGDFVLVWAQERGQLRVAPFHRDFDLASRKVMAQRFRPNGEPAARRFELSSSTERLESWPKIHRLADGLLLAVWSSEGETSDDSALIARHVELGEDRVAELV